MTHWSMRPSTDDDSLFSYIDLCHHCKCTSIKLHVISRFNSFNPRSLGPVTQSGLEYIYTVTEILQSVGILHVQQLVPGHIPSTTVRYNHRNYKCH